MFFVLFCFCLISHSFILFRLSAIYGGYTVMNANAKAIKREVFLLLFSVLYWLVICLFICCFSIVKSLCRRNCFRCLPQWGCDRIGISAAYGWKVVVFSFFLFSFYLFFIFQFLFLFFYFLFLFFYFYLHIYTYLTPPRLSFPTHLSCQRGECREECVCEWGWVGECVGVPPRPRPRPPPTHPPRGGGHTHTPHHTHRTPRGGGRSLRRLWGVCDDRGMMDWLIDWINMCEWMIGWTNDWLNEWMIDWLIGWMDGVISELVDYFMNFC